MHETEITEKDKRQFITRVNWSGPNGCFVWTGAVDRAGYGSLMVWNPKRKKGRRLIAHRIAWSLNHGPIPEGAHICHHCDNRACVNVAHLYLGDAKTNARDRVVRDRTNRGERNRMSRLTDAAVRTIREEWSARRTPIARLAARFYVRVSTIRSVLAGRTWKHVK